MNGTRVVCFMISIVNNVIFFFLSYSSSTAARPNKTNEIYKK
jgi:hypothetical protein